MNKLVYKALKIHKFCILMGGEKKISVFYYIAELRIVSLIYFVFVFKSKKMGEKIKMCIFSSAGSTFLNNMVLQFEMYDFKF